MKAPQKALQKFLIIIMPIILGFCFAESGQFPMRAKIITWSLALTMTVILFYCFALHDGSERILVVKGEAWQTRDFTENRHGPLLPIGEYAVVQTNGHSPEKILALAHPEEFGQKADAKIGELVLFISQGIKEKRFELR